MLDESCSSSSLHPTLTLVARSSSFFAASHLFFPSHGCRRKRQMTRVRMRQHEYYFIVQRRLARHYCWLELLSRPTSVMAHDRRSLYASCAFLCVSPQSRCWAVSAARLLTSHACPLRHLCGPFLCIVRSCAGLPGYNRRAHTTRDSLDTDRREFDSKMRDSGSLTDL